jgi:hypothetical protein
MKKLLVILTACALFTSVQVDSGWELVGPTKPTAASAKQFVSLRASIYHAVEAQCDSTPFITANNTLITDPTTDRFVAMARHMIRPTKWHTEAQGYDKNAMFCFGDSIVVEGAGEFNGIWIIMDSMAKKHKNRIDFLVDKRIKGYDFADSVIVQL